MTPTQIEFLRLNANQVKFEIISRTLNIERDILFKWYYDFEKERLAITKIRNLWLRKKINTDFDLFYDWFTKNDRKCYYCNITEIEIELLKIAGLLDNKREKTRGKTLELDRKLPNESYNNIQNLVLCCYWCNNAKTDTFTHDEFIVIGKTISTIWKKRLMSIKNEKKNGI
jgi:hypothetical protein